MFLTCDAWAEITIQSRYISYDLKNEIICAKGEVLVVQESDDGKTRKLYTDEIEYHKNTGTIKLNGKAILVEPTGEVISADNVSLDQKMEKAIAKALVIILEDAAKVKAKMGTKIGQIYTFEDASYSPCNETGCSLPLWDLFAEKVTYDSKQKSFVYHHVKLRLRGIPVVFLPYFKHPGFGVRRQTGFLSPIIRSNSDTGMFIGTPYFMVLDRSRDLKLTPFVMFNGRGMASGEYRQSLAKGDITVSSSILTKARASQVTAHEFDQKTRWHVDSMFKSFNMDNKRIIFRINRASDVTYKIKFPAYDDKDSGLWRRRCNESRCAYESFGESHYLTTESMIYQTPNGDTAPIILPHITFSHRKDDVLNGNVELNNDTVYLIRKNQVSPSTFSDHFFRTTSKLNWKRSVTVDHVVLDFSSGVKGDVLHAGQRGGDTKCSHKIYPTVENQISGFIPFISRIPAWQHTSIWGPRVTLSSIESLGNREDSLVNEDSIFHGLDELILHHLNRVGTFGSAGEGERIYVGVENSIYNKKRRYLNFFIGKSQSIRSNDQEDRDSFVGHLSVRPIENTSFRMRFVGLPGMEQTKMFESGIRIDTGRVSTNVGYLYDTRSSIIRDEKISQIGLTVSIKLSRYWKISGSKLINLNKNLGDRNLLNGIFAEYKDECFGFGIGFHSANFRDKDIKPKTGIAVILTFKNLVEISNPVEHYLYRGM
ncbi:MAG: LPS assembly protein LptD [Holosporales bacterium]|jgi:LPS-assembly protein|nr:LPS assembly protein LptD [Holosporales bacterium]